jgi:hypothetical protein
VTAAPKAAISAGALAQAKKEQLTAVAELSRWYKDWGTTFRTVFGQRVLIRLGLATLKRSPAAGDDAPDGEDEEKGNGGGAP